MHEVTIEFVSVATLSFVFGFCAISHSHATCSSLTHMHVLTPTMKAVCCW